MAADIVRTRSQLFDMYMTTSDQLGNTFQIPFPPKRIISLVPSQTEFLFDLGLENAIVGITKFCIHPAQKGKDILKIGGTKNFHTEKIKSLHPDLIIGNKEENDLERILELQKHFPVWMSDIETLEDAYAMMKEVSRITDRTENGDALLKKIQDGFQKYQPVQHTKRVAYLIWQDPMMAVAGNTFIDHMLYQLGVENVFKNQTRYPETTSEQLSELQPEYIFLSSEPYPFRQKHVDEFEAKFPNTKVIIVDGEMFSWYGSRLQFVPAYFSNLQNRLKS